MGGGSKGGTSTSTVSIPPEVLARYRSVNSYAENVAKQPFQQYQGQFVAPLTPTQMAGISNTNTAAGQAQPFYGAATGQLLSAQGATQPYFGASTQAALNASTSALPYQAVSTGMALGAANPVNARPLDINTYFSPYIESVLGSTAGLLNQNNQQAMAGQLGNAIRSGAFGGDRAGIAAANLAQQQNLANANIYSNIANQGFNTALGAAQQQQGVNLSADQANRAALLAASQGLQGIGQQGFAQGMGTSQQLADLAQRIYGTGAATSQQLAGLGAGAQTAALQGAQAQLAAGQMQQQTGQAQDTALYNQFLQQQSYPFQVAQFLANIAEGTGSLSGSTTTTNTVQNGIFSDRRLKENIKPIGKTFDGQTIYSYRYKGEQHNEIGLIAQEVEKKHPEAVGLAGGHKTVDYGAATKDAAARGHFASGGGAVLPEHAGEGFYSGGLASGGYDPAMMAQIMANYQAMYGPLLSHDMAGGIVPASSAPTATLRPAEANVPQGAGLAATARDWAEAGKSVGALGDKLGMWKYGDKANLPDWKNMSEDVSSTINDNSDIFARGGLARASGGVIPYEDNTAKGLDIPDEDKRYQLMTPNSSGTGGSSGSNLVSDIGGIAETGMAIAKFLPMLGISDKRAKENIKPVGKTFDGQTVYSYNYKGDHTPRMGLIAQEVEKKHPDAVGKAGGYKTVDYGKATSDAAKRGKFAAGGSPFKEALRDAINPLGKYDSIAEEMAGEMSGDTHGEPTTGLAPSAPAPKTDDHSALAATRKTPPAGGAKDGLEAIGGAKGSPAQIAMLIAKAEGTARNPKSSAIGPFQILNGTLRKEAAKVDPDFAKKIEGMSDSELTAYRASHPELADTYQAIGNKITSDNYSMLQNAGFEPTAGNVYLAHFLGSAGARKVLGADPDTPVSELVGDKAVEANPSVLGGKTAKDVIAWADKRMSQMATKRADGGRVGYADDGTRGDATDNPLDDPSLQDAFDKTFSNRAPAAVQPVPTNDLDAAMLAANRATQEPANLLEGTRYERAPAAQSDGEPKPRGHGFFSGLAHGETAPVLSLLSGIGALATTPTNNVFTALAAGLGAGAQAYQGQREFGLEQQHVRNQTIAAQANAAQAKANAMNVLQDAYGKSIGNASAMAQFQALAKSFLQGGVLTPADLQTITAPQGPPPLAQLLPYMGPQTGGGLGGTTAPNAPAGVPAGLVPPVSATPPSGPPVAPEAVPSIAQAMPELAKVQPSAAPKAVPPAAPTNYINPGDAIVSEFRRTDPDYGQYQNLTAQADALSAKLTPGMAMTPYGEGVQRSIAALRNQAETHKAASDARFETAAAPNVAVIRNKADSAADYMQNKYQQIKNATDNATEAAAQANLNVDSSNWGKAVGRIASIFPGIVPDPAKLLQGGAERAERNRAILNIFSLGGTGISARAEGTELRMLNETGTNDPGPASGYDFAVKTRALAEQQRQYSQDFVKAAPSMTNESQWTTNWLAKHPLTGFIHSTVQSTPLAKGMTTQQAAAYLPPVKSQRDIDAAVSRGDKYVNLNNRSVAEIRRDPRNPKSYQLVPWTGK